MLMKQLISLKPYSKNAKKHSLTQIFKIAASIKTFGFNQPLVIDKNNIIIVGHGRFEAAKKLKLTEVPCIVLDELSENQIKAYRLADNKLNEGGFDLDLIFEELEGLDESLQKLTGFEIISPKIKEIKLKSLFEIVIECESEEEQKINFEKLSKNYKCRLLIL